MFNLFELMQRSQDGQAVEALARQFGLSTAQAAKAVDALLPAFALGFQRMMQMPGAMFMPPAPPPAGPFEAMTKAFSPEALARGQAFSAALFGSADLGKKIAEQAAAMSGVNPATLQQMIPAMASMLAAGAAKSFAEQGMAWVKAFQPPPSAQAKPAAAAPSSGSTAEAASPFDPVAMAALFSRMMGVEPQQAEQPPPPPPTASELGFEAMNQFVETGREVQEQHLRNLQALFTGLSAKQER